MEVNIQPGIVEGRVFVPASKSAMQRACAAALLIKGNTYISNYGKSEDEQVALDILQSLAIPVVRDKDLIMIQSEGLKSILESEIEEVDCGESGLSARMFTPILALREKPVIINGQGSLLKRPMHFFEEILPELNVSVQSRDSRLPLKIKGPFLAKTISIDGSFSSQFVTGLLLAMSVCEQENFILKINQATSVPYIHLTLDMMKKFGMRVPQEMGRHEYFFGMKMTESTAKTIQYFVEGDWSNAAFYLVAGALFGQLELIGLDFNSVQGDRAVLQLLQDIGVGVKMEQDKIIIWPETLKPFIFDATHCPDLFPPLVVLAAYINGVSRIKGVHRLIYKESNRANALIEEFGKMGIEIWIEQDEMVIAGGQTLKGAKVYSHQDHRIVMALATAALGAVSEVSISGAESVNKSYPDFFKDLESIGVHLKINNEYE